MLDIGWTEIVTIVILAVLVIGPRDLPKAMRAMAKMIGKAKAMMREFQSNIDEMIKETELEEVKNQIQSARSFDVKSQITKAIDADGELEKGMDLSKEAAAFNKSMKDDSKPAEENKPESAAETPAATETTSTETKDKS